MADPSRNIKHFWLVGLTGVGKTSIGKKVAATLNMPFVDTDAEVSRRCHMAIADFWEEHGEAAFRRLEREAVVTAGALTDPTVVATGGGAILDDASRALMRRTGLVAWITMDVDYLADRLENKKRRPVLDGHLLTRLNELMNTRLPLYESVSDWVEDASYRTKEDVAQALVVSWVERTKLPGDSGPMLM